MTLEAALRRCIAVAAHGAVVMLGLALMVLGLALGVTMIMLPVGVVIGLVGVLMVVAGLFARMQPSRRDSFRQPS